MLFNGSKGKRQYVTEDAIYLFIDSDNNQYTGYRENTNFPVGAEYMILVQGKHGEVTNTSLYRFTGRARYYWDWEQVLISPW